MEYFKEENGGKEYIGFESHVYTIEICDSAIDLHFLDFDWS